MLLKNRMKKYIFLALLTMGVSSCQLVDVLDQKPEFEADLDGAITTPAAVELALNGIYYSLPGNGFNVIFPTVSGSFKAGTMWRQEIVSAGNAVYYSERMLPTLSFSDATEWDADYAVIKNANFLETACNRMSDGEFSGNRRAEVLGEIAYLRALAYFNILVRYCEFWDMNSEYGVVMRNEAPSVSNALKARSSVADSYQYILDQLEIAIEKAPDWKKLSQASKEAAKALKARVLLYAGKYTEAVAAVNDAIEGIKGEMDHINELKTVVIESVESLAAIAEQNAASTEETSAAMAELSNIIGVCDEETKKLLELAEGLDSSIRTFKL